MKILLIYPYFLDNRILEDDIRVVPQGLFYIAALLESKGHEVALLDWHSIDKTPEIVEAELTRQQPDIIGFSILHANRWGGIDIARTARSLCPRATIVFGGVGATHLWRHLLSNFSEIDYIVLGEGELTFLELVNALSNEADVSIETIDGLALRKSGQPVKTNERAPVCDLDELPNPAKNFTFQHVALTRGCTHNCHFCGSPRFWNRQVRSHSEDYFVYQLELIAARGVRFFYFSDDTFTLDRERVIRVCRQIITKQLGINWAAISRIDLISDEILGWMRRAGCIQISYGVESGSPAIRKKLGKHLSNPRIQRVFELTQSYGIMARAYFIYGCPLESDRTIQETIDLMHLIKPLSTIFYILDIFPGTKLYDDMLQRLGANDDLWLDRIEDILYFETDPDISRDKVLEWGRRLRTSFQNHLPEYVEALDEFLDKIPKDDRYHIETRTEPYLSPPYFGVLEKYGVGQVLSHWTWLPPLRKQFLKSDGRFFNSGNQCIIRLMTPLRMRYEEAYEKAYPFDRLIDGMLNPHMIEETVEIMSAAIGQGVNINVVVNNRAGGNAPIIAQQISNSLAEIHFALTRE